MQQHLVLWGSIGTDRKALLAIYLHEENNQVVIHAFPKDQVDDNLQNQLFAWKNGAPFDFSQNELVWYVEASGESILPREIRVDKPEIIQRVQDTWGKLLMSSKLFKVCKEEIVLHKLFVTSSLNYSHELWDKTADLWKKYSNMFRDQELTWEQKELLKAEVDDTFEVLKGQKRKSLEEEKSQSRVLIKEYDKKIEEQKGLLIYPEEWNKIHEALRNIQLELKSSPLRMQEKKVFFEKIDEIYQLLKTYKKTQNTTQTKDRLEKLGNILKGIETTLEKDKISLAQQQEKIAFYTKGKNAGNSWGGLLEVIQKRITEKEAKVADIKKTISELKQRLKPAANKINNKLEQSEEKQSED
ncbi:MAG: hypothetical protein LC105_10325 [Chitinophagales bacterium]|nr:hypothetical protein [Chitinophagales bacterium]MCZ2394243.1 hypothetical protein [Chitinophagales bacterium]